MNTEHNNHLHRLDSLSKWKVASDDPDVRGWHVKDREGKTVGKVDSLLVSKDKEKVLYLDVEVDKSIIDKDHKPYRRKMGDETHTRSAGRDKDTDLTHADHSETTSGHDTGTSAGSHTQPTGESVHKKQTGTVHDGRTSTRHSAETTHTEDHGETRTTEHHTDSNVDVHEYLNKDGDNHLIIPIGYATLDHDDKNVMTDKISHDTFASTKRYSKNGNVSRDYELNVLENYDRDTRYEEHRDNDKLYERREFSSSKYR